MEQVLKTYFPREDIAPYYFPRDYAEVKSAEQLRPYKLFIGHFDYDLLERLDSDFLKVVLIREPLQLVVSLYNLPGPDLYINFAKISLTSRPASVREILSLG